MLLIFLKRILAAIPVLIIVASLTFFFVRLAPGGPFDSDRAVSEEIPYLLILLYLTEPLKRYSHASSSILQTRQA